MYNISQSDAKIMKDLVRELSEFNSYIKAGLVPFGREYIKGNYFYAFNPSTGTDKEMYEKNIKLLNTLYEILDENCINIKSEGYSFLKDAMCIITDMKSLDVCLCKEVDPYIAEKYEGKSVSKVEHDIRNALASAYRKCRKKYPDRDCIMNDLDEKPTNKQFLLIAVQEAGNRLLNK